MAEFKSLALVFLLAAIVAVSGCINSDPVVEEKSVSEGVELSFYAGTPPEQVGEDGVFDVSVKLENKGGANVANGTAAVHLRGLNPASFEGLNATNIAQLTLTDLARSRGEGEVNLGGYEIITWEGLKYLVDIDSDQSLNIIAQACYEYQTLTSSEVCFNQNVYAQATGTETCTVEGAKEITNNPAPVKVTEVLESPAGIDKFRVLFTINNTGEGLVYDKYTLAPDSCTSATRSNLDIVYIDGFRLGAYDLAIGDGLTSCTWRTDPNSGRHFIRLVEDAGQFMCTLEVGDQLKAAPIFSETLQLVLSYGYTDQVNGKVTVLAIPDVSPTLPNGSLSSSGSGSSDDEVSGDSTILCGNGVIDDGEICDGTNFGDKSCQGWGYSSGELFCEANCTRIEHTCI